MERKSLLFKDKKARSNFAEMGIDLGIGSIFVLAIGLTIAVDVITGLSTNTTVNGTAALTGVAATVAGFVSLVIVAAFIFGVAKLFGLL